MKASQTSSIFSGWFKRGGLLLAALFVLSASATPAHAFPRRSTQAGSVRRVSAERGALARATPTRTTKRATSTARRAPTRTVVIAQPLTHEQQSTYLAMMTEGSLNVSRTHVLGQRFLAPRRVSSTRISSIAQRNFRRAARYVLRNAHSLTLNFETAVEINRMLTQELVPEDVRGNATYYNRDPGPLFEWFGSREALALAARDPVAFAEIVHHDVSLTDAFPDGNGRTGRLLADLVLVQHGLAPALYTDMQDYFQRGAPNAPATRETQVPYFREIVARGQAHARERLQASR